VDRVSDENRLALALTSRFIDQATGVEHFRASIGQAYHFNDRRVHLPNQMANTQNSSDIIAETAMQITPSIQLSQTVQWNAEADNINKSLTRLRYRGDDQRLLNLSYRLRKEESGFLEQTDVSWYWPISARWRSIGRWNYSLEHNRNLETFIGFEYRSCCWAARMVGRHYLQNIDGDYANGVFLQIEFNGLGGAGRRTADFLRESIAGFNDTLPQ
jgi:LPS-assembly protein